MLDGFLIPLNCVFVTLQNWSVTGKARLTYI